MNKLIKDSINKLVISSLKIHKSRYRLIRRFYKGSDK